MDPLAHLDLLSVGIAVAGTTLLGVILLLSDIRSATNRSFFYFTIVTACWSVANYIQYQVAAGPLALVVLRLVIFFATWHAFTFFQLAFTFPAAKRTIPKWYLFGLIPFIGMISLLTLSPFVFERVTSTASNGGIGGIHNGAGLPLFGLTVLALIIGGIAILTVKTVRASKGERHPYAALLFGMFITFLLLIVFNLLLPSVFGLTQFIPFGALFLLPFVLCSAFAILRYKLFNIRVAAIGVLSFLLSTALFTEVIFATSFARILFTSSEFVLVLVFSFWLMKSVMREVKQREHIEKLAADLEKMNSQQIILIHFITHQIKGFVTKSRNIFASMSEQDYGPLPEYLAPLVQEGLRSDMKGSQTIQEILNASNIKSGSVTYAKDPFDIKDLIEEIIKDLKPAAEAKNLAFTFTSEGDAFTMIGDRMQMQNALKNLIDNSIKYTPSGSVAVSLRKEGKSIRFEIKDTGVGITPEDMTHLFTEGGHGKESQKVNVESTGFGLYIVKNIIEAHNGKVWAESEGAGKGSRFIVELPA